LNNLATDPSRPHIETTSGLGGVPQLGSNRAAYLKRIQEFEEENFTRLVMKKSETKRRLRDEADLAFGGDLGGLYNPRARRRAGGLEDEFGDVLRSVERRHRGNDGYEELRKKGKKTDVLSRSKDTYSRKRTELQEDNAEEDRRMKKRSRFELETKIAKKKMQRKR
jgi:U3 small nucleolar ribonucleoprotein protein LCP5